MLQKLVCKKKPAKGGVWHGAAGSILMRMDEVGVVYGRSRGSVLWVEWVHDEASMPPWAVDALTRRRPQVGMPQAPVHKIPAAHECAHMATPHQ